MQNKICTRCKLEKELNDFSKKISGKYGVESRCKVCCIEYQKEYRDKQVNKLKIKKQRKQHYSENKAEILEQKKQYQLKPDVMKRTQEYQKDYRTNAENKIKHREYHKGYIKEYRKNPIENKKYKARQEVLKALRSGKITKPEHCQYCGVVTEYIHAHHHSYEVGQELNVFWLCINCHSNLHKGIA